jgi:VWFA-related protein
MKRFGWILVILMLAMPAWAAKRVTVQQLEELLGASKNKSDADVSNQLSDLELSERLSDARFSALKAALPGDKAQQALLALADQSQILDPPASEIPSTPAPDFAAQRHIMSLVVAYVSKSIPQLPNIFATQQTAFYQETPKSFEGVVFSSYQPLHLLRSSNATVRYSNGLEVVEEVSADGKKSRIAGDQLQSRGIFGPILTTVLMDAAKNKLVWGRWEKGASGPLAVFNYAVPKEKSNYEVDYCCVADSYGAKKRFHQLAGYHGQMFVDPVTGNILRLTLEAELKENDPLSKAAIVVDYGPVEIGGKTYICPVKSISLSRAQTTQLLHDEEHPSVMVGSGSRASSVAVATTSGGSSVVAGPQRTLLNDSVYSDYHIFRAESHVLAGNVEEGGAPTSSEEAKAQEPAAAAPSTASEAAPATSEATAAQAAPPAPAPDEEIRDEEAMGLPDTTPNASQPMPAGFTIQSVARLVDISVLASDKKGHPIRDLKQSDFEVLDNGKKQEVKFFTQAVEGALPATPALAEPASSATAEPVFSNNGTSEAKKDAGKPESSATILLIDSSNLAFKDLSYARSEVTRFLRGLPATEPVGLYILRSHDFQILSEETTDHNLLEEKLSRWMPTAGDLARAQEAEQRNRQSFEQVHNVSDLSLVNGNTISDVDTIRTASSLDPQLRDWGSNPGRDAMMIMVGVARHLAAISGHKNLVWISSDNALVDWSNQADSIEKGDKHIEPNTLKAQEAMNDAHVSVYPLDASQLEAGSIDASVQHRNVELTPAALDNAGLGGKATGTTTTQNGTDLPIGRNAQPGRIMAQMQQDMRPIQGPIRHLADATGGRVFRRSGGISDELKGVVEDGHAAYQLSFYPQGPADGQFHTITVNLTTYQKGVSLRYRTGYLFAKEPATLKERFQQAVWLPTDANQLTVTAQPVAFQGGLRVKITVAAGDLSLEGKDGRSIGNLDVFLVQRDDPGQRAQVEGRRLGLQLKASTLQELRKNGLTVERTVQLKPSITSIRVLVVDENSGRMGSVTIPIASLPVAKGK